VPPTSARRHQPGTATVLLAVTALMACGGVTPAPTPAPEGDLAVLDWSATTGFLDSAAASGAMPGAVLGVSYRGARLTYGTGQLGLDDPTIPDANTVYDLASLTKVVGLTTAVMLAVDEGRLDLDAPVGQYLPRFTGPGKDGITLRQLLTHTSGLPAWRPLYLEAPSRDSALALVYLTDLETPPGMEYRYSDLGAILLTQAVETAWGMGLDSILAQRVFRPLGMSSTTFRPPASWTTRIAPTEDDPWRGRIIRGEVHDENAARLGGVSGHAGLFSFSGRDTGARVLQRSAVRRRGGLPCTFGCSDLRHTAIPGAGVQPRVGLGHALGFVDSREFDVRGQLRTHRLYRNVYLDRSAKPAGGGAADKPGASVAGEQPDWSRKAWRGGPRCVDVDTGRTTAPRRGGRGAVSVPRTGSRAQLYS